MRCVDYRRKRGQHGATAIEYALIAGLIALAIIPALTNLAGGTNGMFAVVTNQVSAAFAR